MVYKTKSVFSPPKALAILATASLASLAISPKAEAILLSTQTQSFTNQLTELTGTPQLTFNRYNGPDILDSVVLTINASLASSGTVTNTAAQAQDFDVTISSRFRLTPALGAPTALTLFTVFPTGTVIGTQEYLGVLPNTPTAFGPFSISNSPLNATYSNPTDVAGFVGAGTYSFNPTTLIATAIAGGGGNVTTSITTLASASIQVEYFGTPSVNPPTTVPFGFSTNASLVVFGGVFYGFNKLRKRAVANKLQA